MKKNDKLHIPISSELKELLKSRASACGLSLSQYCLLVLTNAKPRIELLEIPK